jgi:hypothetical protein
MPKITDQNSENIHKVFHTVRPIRRGYLYVLLEYSLSGSKSKRWQAYTVATGGELSLFNADQPPPEIKDFTCDTEGHREQVSMIQIKNSTLVKDAWMLFTPDPLTLRMLALLKETLIYLTLRKPYDIIGFQSSPLR